MTTIAVDAMGGDHAPQSEVEGALLAAREHGVRVLLVGQEDVLRAELARHKTDGLPVEVLAASQVIAMGENPIRALRKKRDSSLHVAARAAQEGRADGVVTAGNTGAAMAIVKTALGMLPGVDRPALASVFPTKRGTPSVLLDVGANVDCKPQHLQQFAIMGEVYYRVMFGEPRPRVGLLSIGEEASKGNEVVRETHRRLKESSLSFDFVGNVEGRDVYTGDVHVVVCDGFIGNVALKISEGLVDALVSMLKEALGSTLSAKVGSLLSRQAYENFKKRVDYTESGGVPLLGIKGVCVICHGRSNANAIKNAIRVAADFSSRGINEKIERDLALAAAK
ncbi:MAG: phosphate acyltransferase PlsX [Acidobacteria bacterium]|nr:phosphate acyltransferase PlsX [Acidobacteriota bacterium]MCH8946447.1 phosphate acyltransferase PlsX [Acidobacteriota bacterium]